MGEESRSPIYATSFRLEAGPERVFAALSEAEEQARWFAEHSHAMPRLHGSNAFWGKHTIWAPTIKYAQQYFTVFEQPYRLAYHWEIKDLPTEVIFEIKGSKNHARLTMRHELIGAQPERFFQQMLHDFWRIALLNLLWYVETGSPMNRMDYSDAQGDVNLRMDLAAPPPQVFQALTLPAKMDAWLSHEARVELRIGGRYDFGWTEPVDGQHQPAGPTVLKELVQDKKLAYGWSWPGEKGETLVEWELKPLKVGTRITLRHAGFNPERDSSDYKQGWTAFLCLLKLYLERGQIWE